MGAVSPNGGEPASYANDFLAGSVQQTNNLLGLADAEPPGALSSGLGQEGQQAQSLFSETDSLPPQSPHTPNHRLAASPFYPDISDSLPPSSPYQYQAKQVWPSPPLAPGDLETNYEPDVSTSGPPYPPYYSYSPASPPAWSPPGLTVHQSVEQLQHHQLSYRIGTPASVGDISAGVPELSASYPGSFYGSYNSESATLQRITSSPGMSHRLSASGSPDAMSAFTPASTNSLAEEHTLHVRGAEHAAAQSGNGQHRAPPTGRVRGGGINFINTKNEEPYAKLIYRAFMSQPNHIMTLQDIYQWFRVNTTKATNEKGGWQNSIRHNLSMNAAFSKRDQRRVDEEAMEVPLHRMPYLPGAGVKRPNEWFLEDWAVREGVQSTTRYRKDSAPRKGASAKPTSQAYRLGRSRPPTSTKALSGQKGGCAARGSRIRGRKNLCHTRTLVLSPSAPPHNSVVGPHALYPSKYPMPPSSTAVRSGSPGSISGMYEYVPEGSPSSFSLPQVEPSLHTSASTERAHSHDRMGPAPSLLEAHPAESYSLMATATNNGLYATPSASDDQDIPLYMETPQGEYPYDIPDAQMGYPSEQHSSCPSGGEPARLFELWMN